MTTGIQWRMMPKDLPNWKTVKHYFREWRLNGVWAATYEVLRGKERTRKGRKPQPTAGCLDSQSVKIGRYCREEKSYDGGKKVVGRKRHLSVDTEGLPIAVKVTRAGAIDHARSRESVGNKGGKWARS